MKNKLKNKKNIAIILIIMIIIYGTFLFFCLNNTKEVLLDEVKLKDMNDFNKVGSVAIYLEKEDGSGYEISDTNEFPSDMILNTKLSGCINKNGETAENAFSYDGGNIKIRTDGSLRCYLYFRYPKPDVGLKNIDSAKLYSNEYKKSLTCNYSSGLFNEKYQRLEITIAGDTEIECNINYQNDTSTKTLLTTEVQNKATTITSTNNSDTTDTSYRYQGKQPNNWVWFNNELWRIIGNIPTCLDSSCSTKENLVKIIRAESIGGIKYSTSATNKNWGGNTLYTTLNDYYYGKIDATGTDYCLSGDVSRKTLCNFGVKGIFKDQNDYYGRMLKEVYAYAGSVTLTSRTIAASYTNETSKLSKTTVSLMTVSDYGYATSGITFTSIKPNGLSSYEQNNWLYGQGSEWTMTPYSADGEVYVWYVESTGKLLQSGDCQYGYAVRPVVYLNSNVFITGGTGEQKNPYILGM